MIAKTRMNSHRRHIYRLLMVVLVTLAGALFVVSSAAAKTAPNDKGSDRVTTTVTFHIAFEGHPSYGWENVYSFIWCRGTGNGPFSQNVKTPNFYGNFTDDITGTGTFTYTIIANKYLVKSGTFTLPSSGSPIELGTLKAGDANGDNVVNAQDFTIFYAAYDSTCGYPEYNYQVDFNEDCAVDDTDEDLMLNNYGHAGDSSYCSTQAH